MVLPGLGREGLLTMSRSTYLTKGTRQGELISEGYGELLATDTVDETIVPSPGLGGILGSPLDRWARADREFPDWEVCFVASEVVPDDGFDPLDEATGCDWGEFASVLSMLGDWASICDKVTEGRSSKQGLPMDAAVLEPFGNREDTGVFTLGFGGLNPVTAATGCKTAPVLLPAGRWATWKMLTEGVETNVTGSGSVMFLVEPGPLPDGAAVIWTLGVLVNGGASPPLGEEEDAEDVAGLLASAC